MQRARIEPVCEYADTAAGMTLVVTGSVTNGL